MLDTLATLALLVGLELVLGIDNILVISILVSRLPDAQRDKARIIGLSLALVARLLMLGLILVLASMEQAIIASFSIRDIILMAGGLFLLYKAVTEIHHTVEITEEEAHGEALKAKSVIKAAITQIVLLDLVFSVDSVLTAVGLTRNLWVIVTAVVISFSGLLFFAKPVGEFILKNPTLKILALAFLISIGITLCMEGLHQHVPKAYIYLPMGFALAVEFLQLRYTNNLKRRQARKSIRRP